MKITLIYGENQIEARNRFRKIVEAIKTRGWEVRTVNTLNPIAEQVNSNSMFSESILYIIEDVVKISPTNMDWLSNNFTSVDINILAYGKGEINKTTISKFPKDIKIEKFDIPQELFKFLEEIYPGNSKIIIKKLHKITQTNPVEFVFTMIARQLKDLYWVLVDESSTGYPSWRINKIKQQARKYDEEKLKKFISDMAELDVKTKTTSEDLTTSLDFMLTAHLE